MTTPGFTAESALPDTGLRYRTGLPAHATKGRTVVPQADPVPNIYTWWGFCCREYHNTNCCALFRQKCLLL